MDIRPLSDTFDVSPQIRAEDIPTLAAAGYKMVICNRPDGENPPELSAEALRPLVEGAGMAFVVNPVVGNALTMEMVEAQRAAIDATRGKILAYCASGNRSSIVWALALAGRQPTDDLIKAGAQYGYQAAQFRDLIERLATQA